MREGWGAGSRAGRGSGGRGGETGRLGRAQGCLAPVQGDDGGRPGWRRGDPRFDQVPVQCLGGGCSWRRGGGGGREALLARRPAGAKLWRGRRREERVGVARPRVPFAAVPALGKFFVLSLRWVGRGTPQEETLRSGRVGETAFPSSVSPYGSAASWALAKEVKCMLAVSL